MQRTNNMQHFVSSSAFALVMLLAAACGAPTGDGPGAPGNADHADTEAATHQAAIADGAQAARERLSASEGGRLVLRAIEAHGGLEAWYAAKTSSYTWEYANVGADLQFKTYLVADNRTRLVYHDFVSVGPYGAPDEVTGRMAWDGRHAWIWPASIEKINPRFWATTGYYFEQIPFVLADPGITYTLLPQEELGGRLHDMVRVGFEAGVGDAPDDTYTLYVDPESGLIRAIRYTVTFGRNVDPENPPSETLFTYEDLVTVDGLTVATHFQGYGFVDGARGAFKNEAWADSISFSRAFDPDQLAMPDGARVAPPPE